MLDIDGEKDIEVLRDAMKRLLAENARLTATILTLTKQLLTARGKDKAALEQRLAETKAKLDRAQRELFGPKSERREGEGGGDDVAPKAKPKGHGRTPQPGLRTRDVPHDVDEPDKICTQCGSPLTEWQKEQEISEEIDLLQQEFILLRHLRKKWSCACGGCVETAIGPEKLFPGARYSINVAVDIAVKKYLDHMPLERLVRAWSRDGLVVTSQTLWDYLDHVAHFVKPVYDRLHAYVFAQPVIGADETRWRLLATRGKKGSSKTWWVWALTSPKAVVYHLDATRSKSVAEKLLKDYQGIVVCDGYGAYQALRAAHDTVVLAHCWAHVRRELLEVETAFPIEVEEITGLIQQLYLVEQDIPRGPAGDAERQRVRATSSTETIAQIFGWVVKTLPKQTPGNGLARAIRYMAGVWPGLLVFLDNPAVPLDNNASERSMRGPVVGRKNHYGSRSQRGTEVAALLYTILESCKLAGVNPAAYLREAVLAGIRKNTIALPHEWVPLAPADSA